MPGISNYEVYNAIPTDSYLWKYLGYGAQQTDAPYLYHVGCGLAAAASVLPFDARILGFAGWTYSNLWMMLVGGDGRERKSTCIKLATDLIESVDPDLIGAPPGTSQGLKDSLIENPQQIMVLSEMGDHLSLTSKRAYEDIRGTMNLAYDCKPIKRALAGGVRGVEGSRLSVLAGVTPEDIESYTDRTARQGGYMSRYGTLLARRESFKVAPTANEAGRAALAEHLTQVHDLDLSLSGCIGWTAEASLMWESWAKEVEIEIQRNAGGGHNSLTRAQELALKVTLIDALVNFRHNPSGPWVIDPISLQMGITVATWHVRSSHEVFGALCDTLYRQNRRKLTDFLDAKPRTASAVTRHMLLPPRQVDDLLNGLKRENRLSSVLRGSQTIYTLGSKSQAEASEAAEHASDSNGSNGNGGPMVTLGAMVPTEVAQALAAEAEAEAAAVSALPDTDSEDGYVPRR